MSHSDGDWALGGDAQRQPTPPGPAFPGFPLPQGIENPPSFPRGDIENPLPSSLSILLPALNEERGVEAVLKRIPRTRLQRAGLAYSVYLLDGGSTDRTQAVARKFGAQVFVQTGNGKGSAFREFVPTIKEDLTIFLDSDGTYPPEAIPELVGAVDDASPVVLGSRLHGSIDDGAMSKMNYIGNRILSVLASFLFRTPVSDVCSGMWAFDSTRLKSLDLTAKGFELEADIFAECAIRHIPIVEIPIRYGRRIGRPKLRLQEGFRIALALLKKRLRSGLGRVATEMSESESASIPRAENAS